LAQSLGLTAEQAAFLPTSSEGEWRVSVDTNPIDDSKTVVLALTAETGVSAYGDPIALILRCKSNQTEVYINWNNYLGSEAAVTSRIGDAAAQTRLWSLSTDSKATFYPSGDISFIKSLMGVDQFVAQVTPYSESPVTAVFNTSGLEVAVAPLRETCNW
jgi:type VI secretion system protein VasI